jgi:hypothetical protein
VCDRRGIFGLWNQLQFITWDIVEINFRFTSFQLSRSLRGTNEVRKGWDYCVITHEVTPQLHHIDRWPAVRSVIRVAPGATYIKTITSETTVLRLDAKVGLLAVTNGLDQCLAVLLPDQGPNHSFDWRVGRNLTILRLTGSPATSDYAL